jgi:uncharacterized membrane protein
MIDILPNWHPIFVHYSVALLSVAIGFYFARLILPNTSELKTQWLTVANWSLWIGCLFSIATVLAGIYAFNTVAHDSASHLAMETHRNWALPTAGLFLILGATALWLNKNNKQPGLTFLSTGLIALILLMITGWLGAEAVYRYGLGVLSLPEVSSGSDGHDHSHGVGNKHSSHTQPTDNISHEHQSIDAEHEVLNIEMPIDNNEYEKVEKDSHGSAVGDHHDHDHAH